MHMKSETLHIKNMVCPRCIDTVKDIFNELKIETSSIQLGEVNSAITLTTDLKGHLIEKLNARGFELLEDKNSKTIAQIKAIVIEQIHHSTEPIQVNFSTLLSDKLSHDYAGLSKLFSQVEGITIEKFILKQKIEKVKELIVYEELNLSEIAFQLNYSSVAHLSSQFKKETGMTPSSFRKLEQRDRSSLDSI